eukprot:m.104310 g.104310  ORF g.104310 m.104310 type:complete len:562 (-) comp20931_c0_seq1:255-1940(-)
MVTLSLMWVLLASSMPLAHDHLRFPEPPTRATDGGLGRLTARNDLTGAGSGVSRKGTASGAASATDTGARSGPGSSTGVATGLSCNVRDFGARSDNRTLSTRAINSAIQNSSCASVVLSGGGVFVSGSLRLRSHLTLTLEAGTTLRAASNFINAYDPPEPNPWDAWQDFGHSHWHNALLWGDGITGFTLNGGGTIDGGALASANPPIGGGDKVLSLKSSSDITVTQVTVRESGHFVLLATNVSGLALTHLTLSPTRDCLDIVGSSHVLVRDVHCAGGGDDSLVLKSDFSVGVALPVHNVTVLDSSFSTVGATAVEIGSETTGNFTDLRFDNITIYSAGDAGIGMAIMDGSNVRNVHYSNFVMTGVTSPFQFYIGARMLRPQPVGAPGSIRDIVIENVTATDMVNLGHGYPRNWTATLDGQPIDRKHGVSETRVVGPNITFEGIRLMYPGGGERADVESQCPHNRTHWMMVDEVRPAYGFFLRNSIGTTFRDVVIGFEKPDNRPCFVADQTDILIFDNVHCQRGAHVGGYDIGLRHNARHISIINSPGLIAKRLPPSQEPVD